MNELQKGVGEQNLGQSSFEQARKSNGEKIKNVLEKSSPKIFFTQNIENEIIADKNFVSNMVSKFPKKSEFLKTLKIENFVFKPYKIAKKTYGENFQIKTEYVDSIGIFDAGVGKFDQQNVLIDQKDFDEKLNYLHKKYQQEVFPIRAFENGAREFNFSKSQSNLSKLSQLKSELIFQLFNIKDLTQRYNIDTKQIENFDMFFEKNLENPKFSSFYFSSVENILSQLSKYEGFSHICQQAIKILNKIKNPKFLEILDKKPDLKDKELDTKSTESVEDNENLESNLSSLKYLGEKIDECYENGFGIALGENFMAFYIDKGLKKYVLPVLMLKKLFGYFEKNNIDLKNYDIPNLDVLKNYESYPDISYFLPQNLFSKLKKFNNPDIQTLVGFYEKQSGMMDKEKFVNTINFLLDTIVIKSKFKKSLLGQEAKIVSDLIYIYSNQFNGLTIYQKNLIESYTNFCDLKDDILFNISAGYELQICDVDFGKGFILDNKNKIIKLNNKIFLSLKNEYVNCFEALAKLEGHNIDENILQDFLDQNYMDINFLDKIKTGSNQPDETKNPSSLKSEYKNLKSKVSRYSFDMIDKYIHKESQGMQKVIGKLLKIGLDLKTNIEYSTDLFYKDDYEKNLKQERKEFLKQRKIEIKDLKKQSYLDNIWQDKKTNNISEEILLQGKKILSFWRKKMVSFSKNKCYHTDNLIRFLKENNLTFRDIGMTKVERKFILG